MNDGPTLDRRGFLQGLGGLAAAAACPLAAAHPGHATEPRFVELSVPVLVLPDAADLAWYRAQAEADPAVAALRDGLAAACRSWPRTEPWPIEELRYEGHVSNHPDRVHTVEHLADMGHIYRLAWHEALAPDAGSSEALQRYLDAWASACLPTGNAVNDDKLSPILVAFALHRDALAPGLRETLEAWTRRMVDARYKWALAHGRANGHARHIALSVASCRLLGDRDRLEPLIDAARRLMAAGLRPDGTSYDLEYRDALHYHCSFVKSLMTLAALCRPLGVDLWVEQTPDGASIPKSVDYVHPYAVGDKQRGEWADSTIELDAQRAATGDPNYQPGKLWDPRTAATLFRLAAGFDPAYRGVLDRLPDGAGRRTAWEHLVAERAAH